MTTSKALAQLLQKFDPDHHPQQVLALRLKVSENKTEQPVHKHRKSQLIMALHGGVTCETSHAKWMVPPQHAVWIPGNTLHSIHATDNARICLLFMQPERAPMPNHCCTLSISPLLRELILYLADHSSAHTGNDNDIRLVEVLLSQLTQAPIKHLNVPISSHPIIRQLARSLAKQTDTRKTQTQWARHFAMSERTLARLLKRETGLTFSHWRQQLQITLALQKLSAGHSVQTVAGMLGYSSVSAFISMFKKALGKSPTHYFATLTSD